MNLVKNSFGASYILPKNQFAVEKIDTLGGSSLNRKKTQRKQRAKEVKERARQRNSLSQRSKTKIRTKVHAIAGVLSDLVFVTLTFQNKVEDQIAIACLKKFLNNVRKQHPEFEYLWVAEKQNRNKVFKKNIHFHLITNLYWDIDKWWNYWIEVQESLGIVRTKGTRRAGSAFDVQKIKSTNTKRIGAYLTSYLSKTKDTFDCPVWNCSKRVSRLYTAFYSGTSFIDDLRAMEAANELGGKLKGIEKEWCYILLIPLNEKTLRLYDKIHEANKVVWEQNNPLLLKSNL